MMKYKAIMLDVDGTLVPYDSKSELSDAVIQAIQEAAKHVTICIITGRSFYSAKTIVDAIGLKEGYIVVNNGSFVIHLQSKQVLYEQILSDKDTDKIIEILLKEKIRFYTKGSLYESVSQRKPFKKGGNQHGISAFYAEALYDHQKITEIFNKLSGISDLTLHKTVGSQSGKFGFDITHAKSTKAHGIEIIIKDLKITRNEIIAVGDSYNDFPLLMASGLKVAMGNAIPELKEIADYVAPSVYDDGVADVVKRFILEK